MKLKKFFALALAAATLALALTACGSKADDSADNSDANTDNQTGETVTVRLGPELVLEAEGCDELLDAARKRGCPDG